MQKLSPLVCVILVRPPRALHHILQSPLKTRMMTGEVISAFTHVVTEMLQFLYFSRGISRVVVQRICCGQQSYLLIFIAFPGHRKNNRLLGTVRYQI